MHRGDALSGHRIIVYWIKAHDPFHARLMTALRALRRQDPEAEFAVSRLSWLECPIQPLRDNDAVLIDDYHAFFDAGQLRIVELAASVIERAAELRARHGFNTPDALQAARALEVRDDVLFLPNDRQFGRVPGLKVVVP